MHQPNWNLFPLAFSSAVLSSHLQKDNNFCVSLTTYFSLNSTIYKRRTLTKTRRLPYTSVWLSYNAATCVKARLHRRFFFAATRCNFCPAKIASSFKHAIWRRQIALKIAPGLRERFWSCNFRATKLASSCCNKNLLCKRAFMENTCKFYSGTL